MPNNLSITKGVLLTPIVKKILHVTKELDGNLESLTLREIKCYANTLSKAGKNLKKVHKCLSVVESDKSDGEA